METVVQIPQYESKAQHIPLLDGPEEVKLSVVQVDMGKVIFLNHIWSVLRSANIWRLGKWNFFYISRAGETSFIRKLVLLHLCPVLLIIIWFQYV